MMASAFYSTGDGHVGNLGKKTLSELRDLLARQERLVQKKNFLNSLPDKGAKIQQFAETLRRTIKSREKSEELSGNPVPNDFQSESTVIRKDGHKGMSRFKKEREKVKEKEESEINDALSVKDIAKTERLLEPVAFTGDVLERSFQKLTVHSDNKSHLNVENSFIQKPVHFYQLAEEKAKRNAAELKEPLQLNRSLKVSTVQDLPPEFAPPKPVSHNVDTKMDVENVSSYVRPGESLSHNLQKVIEETAATPPTYRYEKAKEISLDESLMLQKSQKVKQDELQAEIAAERLGERLHIKLEPYNPEGIDMSYRVSHGRGQTHLIDSDDDDDDEEEHNDVKIISDSDDDS